MAAFLLALLSDGGLCRRNKFQEELCGKKVPETWAREGVVGVQGNME